jgi:hypothetical protein
MPIRIIAIIITCAFSSVTLAASVPPIPEPAYKIVDDFSYSQRTAVTAFKPMAGSKTVSLVEIDGRKTLRMQCSFRGTKIERASWDSSLNLDLTMCKGLQFLFYCPDPSPVASFVIYLHRGGGWYRGGFDAPAGKGYYSE